MRDTLQMVLDALLTQIEEQSLQRYPAAPALHVRLYLSKSKVDRKERAADRPDSRGSSFFWSVRSKSVEPTPTELMDMVRAQ